MSFWSTTCTSRCYELTDVRVIIRTHLAIMDDVVSTYSFNNNINLRLNEQIKDALDPKGILAPGKNGIWPKAYRADIACWKIPSRE